MVVAIESDLAETLEVLDAVDVFLAIDGVAVAVVVVAAVGVAEAFLVGIGIAGCRPDFLCCSTCVCCSLRRLMGPEPPGRGKLFRFGSVVVM